MGCDIAPGAAAASADAVVKAGFRAWGKTVDLGDPAAAAEWVNWGVQQLGGIDVLFNNASRPAI